MKTKFFILFFTLSSILSYSQYFIPFVEDSIYRSSGYYATIGDILVDNNNLYIVGNNGVEKGTNGVVLNEVAKWNGSSWQAMDNGLGHSGWLYSIQKYHNKIYIGGNFDDIDGVPNTENIGRFNGTTWETLPNSFGGISSYVFDMTVWNDMLILGGGFQTIGTDYYNMPFVVAYNDTDYIDINDGEVPFDVNALAVFNGELYACGGWYTLKKYVGNKHWEDVGGHFSDYPHGMLVDTFNNFLYVAGNFQIVDDSIPTDFVAYWDGYKWTGIGNGNNTSDQIKEMAIYRGDLYAKLYLDDTLSGVYTGRLAKWNGTNWEQGVPGGIKFFVNSLAVYNDELWIGGGAPNDGNNYCPFDTARKTLARWYLPPTINCNYLQPRIQSHIDTFYLNQAVQIHNNNAYVDSWQWDFGDGSTAAVQNPYHTYTDTGTYTVSLTVNWQTCQKTVQREFVVVEDTTTQIQNINNTEQGFKVYPNPTKNLLFVEIKNEKLKIKNEKVQIIDINGKLVKQLKINNLELKIQISDLPKGTYFVKIGNETQQFVKE